MIIMIRIGRIKNCSDKLSYDGYIPIVVMTKSSKYGTLGPYVLKDANGRIMENIWQFSKVYRNVPKSKQYYSQWDRTVVWDYPAETHVDSMGKLTQNYVDWRKAGMSAPYPIRYPVGKGKHRSTCLYALEKDQQAGYTPSASEQLDYINARKRIYLPIYSKLVRAESQYKYLLSLLQAGKNLLILEVDGPHEESLDYYKQQYSVANDFIVNRSMHCSPRNLGIMLNDTLHNFGHGYCLGWCLYEDLHQVTLPM